MVKIPTFPAVSFQRTSMPRTVQAGDYEWITRPDTRIVGKDPTDTMLTLFRYAGWLVNLPVLSYAYTQRENPEEPTEEIIAILYAILDGEPYLRRAEHLFLAASPFEEPCVSGGWMNEYVRIRESSFDARDEMAAGERDPAKECGDCFDGDLSHTTHQIQTRPSVRTDHLRRRCHRC